MLGEKIFHYLMPYGSGAGDSGGDSGHRAVVEIANPDSDKIVRGISDGPIITEIVGCPGFNGNGEIGDIEE